MKYVLVLSVVGAVLSAVASQLCGPEEFVCNNGQCIDFEELVCNGEDDCGDGSDENVEPDYCPPCIDWEFRCGSGKCIWNWTLCNYEDDCEDGSDEEGCPPCYDWARQCDDGECVDRDYFCNWSVDCQDRSDESVETCPCADTEVRCPLPDGPPEHAMPRGICIKADFWCDGERIWDCPDGADERNCNRPDDHLNTAKYRDGMNWTHIY